jgi:hypothetical protein
MPCIAKASPIRTLPCPTVTEAPRARTCNPVRLRDRRNLEARPQRERNEWAIGKLRQVPPVRTEVLSGVFGTAARRGRIATTDIRALDQPAAEGPHAVEDSAEAAEATQAVVAATAAVGTDRSEEKL